MCVYFHEVKLLNRASRGGGLVLLFPTLGNLIQLYQRVLFIVQAIYHFMIKWS